MRQHEPSLSPIFPPPALILFFFFPFLHLYRSANDIRAAAETYVELHRYHSLGSIIRDCSLGEATNKDAKTSPPPSKKKKKRPRPQGTHHNGGVTREEIARILHAEGLVAKKKHGHHDFHTSTTDITDLEELLMKRGGNDGLVEQYFQEPTGRILELPPLPHRYATDVTETWIPQPIDLTCLVRRDIDSRVGLSGEVVDDSKWLTSAKAKRLRRMNRRLFHMMQTPNPCLNTHRLRAKAAQHSNDIGSFPSTVATLQAVSSNEDAIKVRGLDYIDCLLDMMLMSCLPSL